MGCGQLDLARVLFGKLRPERGELAVDGRRVSFRSTASARRAGIAFVPESRRTMLFSHEPVYKNVSISILDRISSLLVRPSRERSIAQRQVKQLQIRPPTVERRSRHAVRRQPAEGRPGQMADLSAQGADPQRADARHGCRCQDRCGRHRPRSADARLGDRRAVHRARDRAVACRPDPGAEEGIVVREFVGEAVSKDRLLQAA